MPPLFLQLKKTASVHTMLPLPEERNLISLAKKGDIPARQKLQLHLLGFFIFRIETTLHSSKIREFREDILQECVLLASVKIHSYKLRYRTKPGEYKMFRFSTYLWKAVTGIIFQQITKYNNETEYFDSADHELPVLD